MKYTFFTLILFIGITIAKGQNNGTCSDALVVESSPAGPFIPAVPADASLIDVSNLNMYFGKPHRVVWFTFQIPYDTVLTFDIEPVNSSDDFDFILFRGDKGDFCEKEAQKKIKPVRTNFSQAAKSGDVKTGLSTSAIGAIVGPNENPPYSSAIKVKKGERFYLAVDYYTGDMQKMGDGFILNLYLNFNKPAEAPPIVTAPVKAPSVPHLLIHVLDSAGNPVKASLIIDGAGDNSINVDTTDYSLTLPKNQTIQIRANAGGHMPYQQSYTTTDDTAATFLVKLQPIKVAEKISLKDIHFKPMTTTILPESRPALEYLLQFMKNNKKVKIMINGYVNDPNNSISHKENEKISEKRAEAVKEYLVNHGINENRMQVTGYGNSKMLYPNPTNEEEREANRRVEIEIK